ncbi:bifunctional metallophosphatase/5'-nucleotidase [Ureibacillus chungkukjangi]|uniref:2',3'-cyclic-nucleotide 2'-phosphodiesterase (5'-nucleotidase family) n=1 Tax=Ureibacillus chungkukjangi TaxID=1202712 RepID=A0A318TB94_9BACL|nr:bifunctional UDP-sugar hydrolase/5'-nucleotidase [Ureibacillus chungkukjangi]PYF01866.1 2',3'-cyclic-nucleotide 2'-phosphodiesterase (5'-nucleotidase family) [Ureibacillus chungkukjangi]
MLETIHIFHTNDIHSHFEYWQRMHNYIKTQRQEFSKLGETSFLFDIGDHIDRSNIYTEATLGKGNVQLLNEAQYDAVTIGNNEGITLAFEELHELYNEANFDVIVGNIEPMSGPNPKWLKPYTILQTKYGTKIGVIGATAIFEVFYKELNWHITEPREVLIYFANQLRDQVDILVCLSHLGITEDELLANECPSIDVIFGSHTHHLFEEGKVVNNVLLTGCGKFGMYTGHLTLQFDHTTRNLVKKKEMVIENAILPEADGEALFLANLTEQGKKLLQTPIFQTSKNYNKEWFHYSQLSELFAKAVLDFTDADCTMFNAGILLDSLKKGIITNYDIHKILPHPINICVIELSGVELKEVYLQAQNEQWPLLELKGLGFRGSIFGKMLTYEFTMNKQRELLVNGKVVDLNQYYKLATLDMFTFGYFFPSFKYAKKKYYLPLFLRDILIEYGKKIV